MDPAFVGDCRIEPVSAPRDFAGGDGWTHVRVVCECGSGAFRVVGWPRSGAAAGGVFWQTFSRAFREARAAFAPDAESRPLFALPIEATCETCGRERLLLDDARIPDRLSAGARRLPRESFRCRVCRRGAVSLRIASIAGPPPRGGVAVELHVHCLACHRGAPIAAADSRASEQQQRLDRLYGRS